MSISFMPGGSYRRKRPTVLLLAAAFAIAAPSAAGQDRPDAGCSAERLIVEQSKITTDLQTLPRRYPWLKSASLVCNGLAMGDSSEQAAILSACVARECAASRRSGSCAADASSVYDAVDASARRRAQLLQAQERCRPAQLTAASGDPLAAYFLLQLAMARGDVDAVRRQSFGSDSDFETLRVPLDFSRAVEDFMRQSAASRGLVAAEFAQLEYAGSVRVRPLADVSRYKVTVAGDRAEIVPPDSPSVAHFRRIGGTWKSDLSDNAAINASSTPDAAIYFRLLAAGYGRVTELVRANRIAWPATGVSAAQGCMQTGALFARASADNGVGLCKTFIDRRFPAPEGSQEPDDPRGGSVGAATLPRSADTVSMQALLDDAFRRWSGTWFADRYVADSALVEQQRCSGDTCGVAGQFTVLRLGQSLQVPFTATLTKAQGGYALSRLCYDDASSNMRDCM